MGLCHSEGQGANLHHACFPLDGPAAASHGVSSPRGILHVWLLPSKMKRQLTLKLATDHKINMFLMPLYRSPLAFPGQIMPRRECLTVRYRASSKQRVCTFLLDIKCLSFISHIMQQLILMHSKC